MNEEKKRFNLETYEIVGVLFFRIDFFFFFKDHLYTVVVRTSSMIVSFLLSPPPSSKEKSKRCFHSMTKRSRVKISIYSFSLLSLFFFFGCYIVPTPCMVLISIFVSEAMFWGVVVVVSSLSL